MANPTWPAGLPAGLLLRGYRESPPANTLRSSVDAGPPKVRRKSSVGLRPIQGNIRLTAAQVDILDVFYVTTLNSGVSRFDWTHPRNGAAMTFRFFQPPAYTPMGRVFWQASINLEILL